MKFFDLVNRGSKRLFLDGHACGECQTSCQSACKTSCTVANQPCERIGEA